MLFTYEFQLREPHYPFCLVPDVWVTQELFWSCGQVEFEGEAKHAIHSPQEVQAALNLLLNLRSETKGNRICIIHLDFCFKLGIADMVLK